jgi:phosphatidylglycerol lysyltransferase
MTDARERVLRVLKRHGWNATSFQVLEEGFEYWFDGDDACVAYVDTGRAWVVAGAPLAAVECLAAVAAAFIEAGARAGRRVVFFATEQRFAGANVQALLIGEQPVWDPAAWAENVRGSRSVREQLRRARSKGVTVRRVSAADLTTLRPALERLKERWLASRPLAPMGFLVDVQPFSFPDERRYFVAEASGMIVGLLVAVPIYARPGWLCEDLLRDPAAPNGTAELLVDAAMTALAGEGSRYVTLGLAPLSGPVTGVLRAARDLLRGLYSFQGVAAFRAKLRPGAWDPIYLAYPAGRTGLASTVAILDTLAAFARGPLAGFGLQTLLRGPAFVVRALALLLVPWTILLATLDGRHFPFPLAKPSWVAFDVVLAGSLLVLAARWRRWLASTLAAAVTADAVLTWLEVLLYNVPRARGWDWLVLAAGTLAPTLAAVILWQAIGHRAALDVTSEAARAGRA